MIDFKNQRLLVIAPHSDDEVLGCGGLIHRIKAAGGKVYVLFLTLGTTRDYSPSGISTSQMRMQEIIKVMAYLKVDGFDIAFKGAKYHLKLDGIPNLELINIIEKKSKVAIDRVRPNIITTSQLSDYNQDHRSANLATLASTRPSPHDLKPFVPLVLSYEFSANAWAVSGLNTPNFFVSLDKDDLTAKIKAMQLYKSQSRAGFHTRSHETIESLARLRGAQTGSFAAEAYFCHRFYL